MANVTIIVTFNRHTYHHGSFHGWSCTGSLGPKTNSYKQSKQDLGEAVSYWPFALNSTWEISDWH